MTELEKLQQQLQQQIDSLKSELTRVSGYIIDNPQINPFTKDIIGKSFSKTDHNHDSDYADIANGVTGGNTHNHDDGDGGAISAGYVTNTPAGNIAATNVQDALNELDTEKSGTSHTHAISSGVFTKTLTGSTSVEQSSSNDFGFVPRVIFGFIRIVSTNTQNAFGIWHTPNLGYIPLVRYNDTSNGAFLDWDSDTYFTITSLSGTSINYIWKNSDATNAIVTLIAIG
jgi:hypothetical protein